MMNILLLLLFNSFSTTYHGSIMFVLVKSIIKSYYCYYVSNNARILSTYFYFLDHSFTKMILQLLTGISIILSNFNPFCSATVITSSKFRIPHEGSRDFNDASKALHIIHIYKEIKQY